MSWTTTLLELCKRYGSAAKFAANTVLSAVLPGSPAVIALVEQAFETVEEKADNQWDLRVDQRLEASEADLQRLSGVLDVLLGGPIGGIVVGAASAGGGALYAKLVDTGIKDATVDELRTAIPAGRTALALLISHVSLADLQRELARFPGAVLVETDLAPAAVSAVQEALAEANRAPFTN